MKNDSPTDVKSKAIVVADGIVAALGAKGCPASYARRKMLAHPSGCRFAISFPDEVSVPVRVYAKNGAFRLEIGAWSDDAKKNVPEPRSGVRFDDLADVIVRIATARRELIERAAADQVASRDADAINASVGLLGNGPICAASNGRGGLVVRGEASGTRQQIEAVLREAIRVGLVAAENTTDTQVRSRAGKTRRRQ